MTRTSPDKSEFWKSAAALAIGLVLSFAILELATRWLIDDGMNFDLEMWKYASDIKQVSDLPAIGHEHRPSSGGTLMGVAVAINSLGLRDDEMPEQKPDGTMRILMLGDSVTFGWGVAAEDTVSETLQRRLNARTASRPITVINAGVGNYNTSQEVAYFLEHGWRLQPDIVVLNYFINDAEPLPVRHSVGFFDRSYAAVYILGRIDLLMRTYFGKADWREYYESLYADDAEGWQQTQRSIADLIRYCRSHGIGLLIANYPELHALDPYPFETVTRAIARLAQANDVAFVDLLPSVAGLAPESLWVTMEDAHPNAAAASRFADVLADTLESRFPASFAP